MEYIFHEKQEGRMCAQHCLNNLLQGQYFNPVDLGSIAANIDNMERIRMAESGTESQSYNDFINTPSENVDDTGFFSVEVIKAALMTLNLELVLFNSTDNRAEVARKNPSSMEAYICNYHQHWYSIRKLGNQWFNLDSTLKAPSIYSDSYLEIYLVQILAEGHSVFIVSGDLPHCEADEIIRTNPVIEIDRSTPKKSEIIDIDDSDDEEERNIKLALKLSMDDANIDAIPSSSQTETKNLDIGEIRKKRLQRFCP